MTSTVTTVATPVNSSTVTSKEPTSLMCSGSRTCLRSISTPLWTRMASTTSAGPMEPKSRPPPPARAEIGMTAPARIVAWPSACAPVLGLAQVAALAHLLRLALHAVGLATMARPFGQEEVPGEAAGHLDDVAAAADAVDVVPQEHPHWSPSSSGARTRSPTSATTGARPPARRLASPSALLAVEGRDVAQDLHAGVAVTRRVGADGVAQRPLGPFAALSTLAPVTSAAAPTGALGHRPLRVRQEDQLTGRLDGLGQCPLVLGAVPGDPARADLPAVAHVLAQHGDVLVVDPLRAGRGRARRASS